VSDDPVVRPPQDTIDSILVPKSIVVNWLNNILLFILFLLIKLNGTF
jgi:hypothetical protein